MPLVAPNEGLPTLLGYLLNQNVLASPLWNLTLFVNDLTPTQTTVYADLTQPTFAGFSPAQVSPADWTTPILLNDQAYSQWGSMPTTWPCAGGTDVVYGHAIVTSVAPKILFVERWYSPVDTSVNQNVGVLPTVSMGTLATLLLNAKIRAKSGRTSRRRKAF